MFFFFKQKTAYEMRISDWSSDVCSSDLINFGARVIMTAGDELDVLVAMNPAALKVNLADVKPHGLLILDSGAFRARNLAKAGYGSDPRTARSLEGCRVLTVDM